MRTLGAIALAAAAVLLGAGCGGSREAVTSTRATPAPRPVRTLSVVVYLLRDGRVAPAKRTVRTRARPEVAALRELLRGPTARDAARGLATAIPADTTLGAVFLRDRVATVDLHLPSPDEDEGSTRPLTAQVVYTLTELSQIEQVAFGISPQEAGIRRRDVSQYAPR